MKKFSLYTATCAIGLGLALGLVLALGASPSSAQIAPQQLGKDPSAPIRSTTYYTSTVDPDLLDDDETTQVTSPAVYYVAPFATQTTCSTAITHTGQST